MTMSKQQTTPVQVLRPAELEPRHWSAWNRFIAGNPLLSSPLFSPEYCLAVSETVPNVFVGILENEGEPVAFLPFERGDDRIGKRLHLCDFQGLIALPETKIDIRWFIRKCGLRAWDFDHLLAAQEVFTPFHRQTCDSPFMDLSMGFENYVVERRAAGTEQIKKSNNLKRRLEREVGPLRLELHVPDQEVLTQLLNWRSSKYEGSRHRPEVVSGILGTLLNGQSPGCQGTLSVLYANDEIAACHFGLRSRQTWHYWFPSYNPRFEKYSPGNILLIGIAELAPRLGITRIDLGKGEQDYKRRFMNGSVTIADGFVPVSSLLSLSRSIRSNAGRCLRRMPALRSLLRPAAPLSERPLPSSGTSPS